MKIANKDPRTRLQETPLKQAKERRQSIINGNNTTRLEEVKMNDPNN